MNNKKKTIIYKSDLKNKKNKNFDELSLYFDNKSVEKMFKETDLDTLEYRIKECEESNYSSLDLKHLELIKIPDLPEKIYDNISHLFLGDNKLETTIKLKKFKKLETLELSNNNLKELIDIPLTITELSCKYNNISKIRCLPKLRRLDCSNNKITSIEKMDSLEILDCRENNLVEIPEFKSLKKLYCSENQIVNIHNLNEIEYLDCSKNKLKELPDLPKVVDLLICHNNITNLPTNMNCVKYIEILNTSITLLQFYSTLKELYSGIDQIKKISSKYKVKNTRVHKNKLLIIEFE